MVAVQVIRVGDQSRVQAAYQTGLTDIPFQTDFGVMGSEETAFAADGEILCQVAVGEIAGTHAG